jgi:hypothetical protein
MIKRYVLIRFEVAGSPDDGMTPVYTGCFDGYGKRSVASINDKFIIPDSDHLAELEKLKSTQAELRQALAFAQSVIKSGEPWTETCQKMKGGGVKHE